MLQYISCTHILYIHLFCVTMTVYMQKNNLIWIKIAFISNSSNIILNSCHVNKLLIYICICYLKEKTFFKQKGNWYRKEPHCLHLVIYLTLVCCCQSRKTTCIQEYSNCCGAYITFLYNNLFLYIKAWPEYLNKEIMCMQK